MIAKFSPCKLRGTVSAPPSKSMAHRYLIGAALSGRKCTLSGIDFSEDILATVDCLKALGADISVCRDEVTVNPRTFMKDCAHVLNCRESGSTLRFFIPLALCLGRPVVFRGSERLFARPLNVYEELCKSNGFTFDKGESSLTVCGHLESGSYRMQGSVSSQFITGMIFALVYLSGDSEIQIVSPLESKPYIDMTVSALRSFGSAVNFCDECKIEIKRSSMHEFSGTVEGDYSNAAFFDAFNRLGSEIKIENLDPNSLQGDKIYTDYFSRLDSEAPTLDISNCPDLGPVLIALAALKNGATLIGTDRLKAKESDRGLAMHTELQKLGGGVVFGNNSIIVPKQALRYTEETLDGHNDHRVVMALSVILAQIGGTVSGAEAVRKSYPGFFDDIIGLGAQVKLF